MAVAVQLSSRSLLINLPVSGSASESRLAGRARVRVFMVGQAWTPTVSPPSGLEVWRGDSNVNPLTDSQIPSFP